MYIYIYMYLMLISPTYFFLSFFMVYFWIQSYLAELEKTTGIPRILPGGFHTNPKGIELALKVSRLTDTISWPITVAVSFCL